MGSSPPHEDFREERMQLQEQAKELRTLGLPSRQHRVFQMWCHVRRRAGSHLFANPRSSAQPRTCTLALHQIQAKLSDARPRDRCALWSISKSAEQEIHVCLRKRHHDSIRGLVAPCWSSSCRGIISYTSYSRTKDYVKLRIMATTTSTLSQTR